MKFPCSIRTFVVFTLLSLATLPAAETADELLASARAKTARQEFDGATADCTETIELAPEHAPACQNRGTAKKANGDRLGATEDLDKALQLEASHKAPRR